MSREKQLEKLVIALEARTAKYKADLDRAKKKTGGFAKSVKKDLSVVQGAFATLGVAFVAKKVVDATAKQEQAVRQLEQGLKTTNQAAGFALSELTNYASELQKVTNFGDEDIISAQAKLVTFTKITGSEFNRTMEAALDLSTRMDQDLKSSVVQLGKALNDPITGLSALSRTGIQFTSDQKEVIKALSESGRQAEAQRLILKELEVQFGGSARAARLTFGGALTSLDNAFGDLLESNEGLEDARLSVEGLTKSLSDPNVVEGVNRLTGAIVAGFSGALRLVADVTNAIGFLAEEFSAYVNGPALDDMVRIEEKIQDTHEKIARIRKWGANKDYDNKRIAALQAELAVWERKLVLARELAGYPPQLVVPVSGKSNDEDNKDVPPVLNDKLKTWEGLMDGYKKISDNTSGYIEDSFVTAFDSMNQSMSRNLAQAIVEGESMKDVFGQVAKTFAVDMVSGLIKMGTQMAINAAFGKAAQAEQVASAQVAGPAIAGAYAPAATMTSIASFGGAAAMALSGIAAVAALTAGMSMAGMAHDGISNVPKEGTWLLDKGERVLSSKQNKDFTDLMKNGGFGGASVTNVFQISAGVEGTVQSEIRKILPDLERLSRMSVERAIRGGGSMARAVGVR